MADVCFVVFSFGAEICGRGIFEELQAKALGSEFRVRVGPELHPPQTYSKPKPGQSSELSACRYGPP